MNKAKKVKKNFLVDPVKWTVREYFDHSLTILWSRIIMARNGKKHLKHCNHDSVAKFELEDVGINKKFYFSAIKTKKT